jgi:protein-S-isoprenylcysteine O-methyltransferase Ste14
MPRILDVAFAAAIAGWGVAAFSAAPAGPVGAALLALQLCVAALFLVRRGEVRAAPGWALALASPAVVAGAFVLAAAPAPSRWPWPSTLLFCAGVLVSGSALLTLGRSFAVLPGLRGIVVGGPYRLVRHPAYLGELAMVSAAALARGDLSALFLALLAVALVVVRIGAEESLLSTDAAYRAYAVRVRSRLLPGLW